MTDDNAIGKGMLVCEFCNQKMYPNVSITIYLEKPRILRPTPIVRVNLYCPKCNRILATTYRADMKRRYHSRLYTEYVGHAKIEKWML